MAPLKEGARGGIAGTARRHLRTATASQPRQAWTPRSAHRRPLRPPHQGHRAQGRELVGCNYSIPCPDLQVRDSSVVPAWPTGIPPSGRLPGPRGYLAEPSLSGKHSPLDPVGRARASQGGAGSDGQGSVVVGGPSLSSGEFAGHRRNPISAPHRSPRSPRRS
jgi:hypothetical protein